VIVVDVNVIAYLLIDGEHTAACEAAFRADPEWAVPLLWRSEWRNVLAGYLRRGELDRAGVDERLSAAAALVRDREFLVEDHMVFDLVASSACSAYDCEYLALAVTLDTPLLTFDGRLLADFPERARAPMRE
jgi:predicted nucleic acid-binding protein